MAGSWVDAFIKTEADLEGIHSYLAPLPAASSRGEMLYWVADQMGVWAGDLQDMDPVEGGKFLALCQSLGSSRTRYLEALIRQLSTLISILSRPATPSI